MTRPNVLYAYVDNYEKAREPSAEELADSDGLPSAGIIKGATIYRSDDAGKSWRQASGLTPDQKKYMEGHSNTYGWVFAQIRVDPNDENTVYTMGLSLNVSRDGGKTFAELDSPGGRSSRPVDRPGQTSNYLINGFDQGVAVLLLTEGRTWKSFRDVLPVCQFFNLNYDMATPFKVYGSMQDHGSFRAPVDSSRGRDRDSRPRFEGAPGGEGSNHAIDPTNPNIVYSAGFYGTISRVEYDKPGTSPGRPFSKTLLPVQYENETPSPGRMAGPVHPLPPKPQHSLPRHAIPVPVTRPGRHLGKNLARLDYNTASEMGDIPYHTLFAISESPLKFGLIYAGTDDGKFGSPRTAEGLDGNHGRFALSEVGLAPRGFQIRTGHGLYDPKRQTRRRLSSSLYLEIRRLRQDVGRYLQGHPPGPGQRDPRGSVNKPHNSALPRK